MLLTTPSDREQEIFAEAIDIVSSPKRRGIIERACGDDTEMTDRVNVRQARQASIADVPPDRSHAEGPGMVIGRYKLLEKIGERGQWRSLGSGAAPTGEAACGPQDDQAGHGHPR